MDDRIALLYLHKLSRTTPILCNGWPETWYEWHKVMPALAKDYTVIAPDLLDIEDSSKPLTGYDGETDIHKLGFKRIFLRWFPFQQLPDLPEAFRLKGEYVFILVLS